MTDDAGGIAIYGNRRLSLLAALACAAVGIYAGLSYFVWPTADGGIPWGHVGPLNLVVSTAITLALAAGMAFALFRMLTPVPLLEFDAAGIHYRPMPRRGWFVPWTDIAHVWLIKDGFHVYLTSGVHLMLYVRPKAGPAAHLYRTRMLRVELSQRSLVNRPQELVERIQRFHHIEDADYTGKARENPTP